MSDPKIVHETIALRCAGFVYVGVRGRSIGALVVGRYVSLYHISAKFCRT